MAISMGDMKGIVVDAIRTTAPFVGLEDHVYPFRHLEPGRASEQAASKISGLAAFVSIDRIQKGREDNDPSKSITIVVDLWVDPWTEEGIVTEADGDPITLTDGTPVYQKYRNAEDILAGLIRSLDGIDIEKFPDGRKKFVLAIQDAFRVADVPRPLLAYRIISTTPFT